MAVMYKNACVKQLQNKIRGHITNGSYVQECLPLIVLVTAYSGETAN